MLITAPRRLERRVAAYRPEAARKMIMPSALYFQSGGFYKNPSIIKPQHVPWENDPHKLVSRGHLREARWGTEPVGLSGEAGQTPNPRS